MRRHAADALTAQGLDEIVGWSLGGPGLADRLRLDPDHPLRRMLELANPLSGDLSVLRTTLLGSLLDTARHNRARGAGTIRLFEAGAVYLPDGDGQLPREPYHVGAVLIGPARRATWRDGHPPAVDFFAIKGVLAGLLDTLRVPWTVVPGGEPFLHPGRAANILADGEAAGWIGEIHPLVAAEWDLDETVAAFELNLDAVAVRPTTLYRPVSGFPDVREDLAVVLSDKISAAELVDSVRGPGRPLLVDVEVFDVYRDPERLGEGNVSMALRLTFRAPDRTLTDEEVAERRRAIAAAIERELGGRIRAA
jgi:phenylalanyl-tRNA synthetase beta chain